MEENRVNALAEFLKVVPETVRLRARRHQDHFQVDDQGQRINGLIKDFDGRELSLRFDFDPVVFNIVAAYCNCRNARQGSVCEHICGFAEQLVDNHQTQIKSQKSLSFLDKHFNAPSFQNAHFRLSVAIEEAPEGLEPVVLFHKFIKEGTFGVGRKFTANDSYKFTQGDPADQNLLDFIKSFRQIFFYSNYDLAQRFGWGFWLSLLGHPRVTFDQQPFEVLSTPANLVLGNEGASYELSIDHGLELDPAVQYYEVSGGILGLSRKTGQLLVCQADKLRSEILMEVNQFRPKLSQSQLITNLPRLEKLQRFFDIQLPEDLSGLIKKREPELVLLLSLDAGTGFTLSPRIHYQGTTARMVPGIHGQYLTTEDDLVVERDQDLEREKYREFLDLFPYEEQPDQNSDIQINDLERSLVLIEWLKNQKRWSMEWLQPGPRISRPSGIKGLRAQVDTKAWLKIHVLADDREYVIDDFPQEDRFLADTNYVAVGEGEWLLIDRNLRRQLNRFKMAVTHEAKGMKLKNAALALLSEAEDIHWEGDPGWLAKIKKWRKRGPESYKPSKKLKGVLRNYQLDGFRWLRRMSELEVGACLADDMGLGKTIQALAVLLDRLEEGPILVVAPASVCFNWKEETKRFAPSLKAQLYTEGRRTKKVAQPKNGEIQIISYALVLKDFEKLVKIRWGTLVLDEAQFIKNAVSQTAAAVSQLNRKWTLALTGTPLENHLGELWSIFRMLNPELLGGWDNFRKRYVAPIEKGQDQEKLNNLRRLIQPFILRRTKQKVLSDLPERSDILLKVVLGETQRNRYEQERQRILSQLDESQTGLRFKLLAAITRLRQLACHPNLCEEKYKGEAAKLTVLSELVEELVEESHKVLIFSQFTSFLGLIAQELNRIHVPHLVMTGETPVKHRQAIIDRFQSGEVPVFLVSLRAGGTGLNLTHANYVVHMDPWWNPSVEEQATDRAHRIGQTKAVTVYRLVASNTIEEAILNIHDRKRDLIQGLLSGKDNVGKLDIDDLVSLIKDNVQLASSPKKAAKRATRSRRKEPV